VVSIIEQRFLLQKGVSGISAAVFAVAMAQSRNCGGKPERTFGGGRFSPPGEKAIVPGDII